jgi:Zn-dependent alcohol dehydrogenase
VIKFNSAVLFEQGGPLEVVSLGLDNPLTEGQVLVRMVASTICGSQLLEIEGLKGNARFMPHALGHEGFGEVLEIGSGVRTVNVGDFVVAHWKKGAGLETAPIDFYLDGSRRVGAGPITTFSELSVIAENRLTTVSKNTVPSVGALMGCALSTGFSAVTKELGLLSGESVLVFGAGGVGISVAIAARNVGAGSIVVVDRGKSKREFALANGATGYVDIDSAFWDEACLSNNKGYPFHRVVEATGAPVVRSQIARFLSDGGTALMLGQSNPAEMVSLGSQSELFGQSHGKTFKFSQGGSFSPQNDLASYLEIAKGAIPPLSDSMISRTGRLSEINELVATMTAGLAGRPLIDFTPEKVIS